MPVSPEELVQELRVPHRARSAYRRLKAHGRGALPAVEAGLTDSSADVRFFCTLAMDHLAGTDSFPTLLALIDDDDPRVRLHALHALACDRCKEDEVCTLGKEELLPVAIRSLQADPDAHVRAMAAEVVGKWVHDDDRAVEALETAKRDDNSSAVRKKAGWYTPGGTIFLKSASKTRRR